MNQEEFEKVASSRLTRRSIVSTGTKLAYAAPVVAASMKLSGSSALATHTPGHLPTGGCFHSINEEEGKLNGCMEACKACFEADAVFADVDPCAEICQACQGTEQNECPSEDYCDPACYECAGSGGTRTATFICGA